MITNTDTDWYDELEAVDWVREPTMDIYSTISASLLADAFSTGELSADEV